MKTYSGNPSFSNQKNLEETEQQLDEVKDGAGGGGGRKTPEGSRAVVLCPAVLAEAGPPSGRPLQAVCGAV